MPGDNGNDGIPVAVVLAIVIVALIIAFFVWGPTP
jgi:hypothetical protein